MTSNIDEFQLALQKFVAEELPEIALQLVRKVSLSVGADIIENTPVDTGYARSNWWPSAGTPVATVSPEGTLATGNDPAAALASLKAFEPFYWSNHVTYINKLEYGHSKQAPQGMVRIAIERARLKYGL
jgi:hypothetical protein